MDMCEKARQRKMATLARVSSAFQRTFGRNIVDYVFTQSGLIAIDFHRLFAEIGVPLDETSIETMRRKYGPEAVALIGELIP